MQGILEVLRVQRHDFMNHLQVISGLLQLKHYDRAKEYIKQAAEDLQRGAASSGFGLEENFSLPCAAVEVLKLLLDTPALLAEDTQYSQSVVDLGIREEKGAYLFQVSFKCRDGVEHALNEKISCMRQAAESVNGGLKVLHEKAGITVLTLAVPTAGSEAEAAAALE